MKWKQSKRRRRRSFDSLHQRRFSNIHFLGVFFPLSRIRQFLIPPAVFIGARCSQVSRNNHLDWMNIQMCVVPLAVSVICSFSIHKPFGFSQGNPSPISCFFFLSIHLQRGRIVKTDDTFEVEKLLRTICFFFPFFSSLCCLIANVLGLFICEGIDAKDRGGRVVADPAPPSAPCMCLYICLFNAG